MRVRWVLVVLLTPLGIAVALSAAWVWRLHSDSHAAAERMVQALESMPAAFDRPSHVDPPQAGTVADGLEPVLPRLRELTGQWRELAEDLRAACGEVRDGKRPFEELAAECQAQLEAGAHVAEAALMASRRAQVQLPPSMHWFNVLDGSGNDGMLWTQHALRLGAFEVRRRVAQGRADEALPLCVDGLGLSRDLSYGGGLIGAMIGVAGTNMLQAPCEAALRDASPPSRAQAASALVRVREGMRPFAEVIAEEKLFMHLMAYGALLTDAQRARLPDQVQKLAAGDPSGHGDQVWARPILRDAVVRMEPLYDDAVEAMRLEPEARRARLEELGQATADSVNPIVRMGFPDFNKFAERADGQRAILEGLIHTASEPGSEVARE